MSQDLSVSVVSVMTNNTDKRGLVIHLLLACSCKQCFNHRNERKGKGCAWVREPNCSQQNIVGNSMKNLMKVSESNYQ